VCELLLLSLSRVRVCVRVRVCSRLLVRVRSLRDVVVVTVHRLTVQGSCGPWELGYAAGLSKSSWALLKFSSSGADVVFTFTSEATLSSGGLNLKSLECLAFGRVRNLAFI